MRRIVLESLERASMRILKRRYKCSKRAIMTAIHVVTKTVKDSGWIASRFKPQWSGVLVVDGTTIKVFDPIAKKLTNYHRFTNAERKALHRKTWICGVDHGTGDLPHYALADEESMIELVLFFRTLKAICYPLRVVVSDGNPDIIRAARFVYGQEILHQRCTRHYLEALRRDAREAGFAEDETVRAFIAAVKLVIEAEDIVAAAGAKKSISEYRHRWCRRILSLLDNDLPQLTTHLTRPEYAIPHTTNDVENLFRQLNLRIRSIGRFGRFSYADNYLKAWALWRRFTPFSDCRGPRKRRNGKAPLACAGSNIVDIDFLSL